MVILAVVGTVLFFVATEFNPPSRMTTVMVGNAVSFDKEKDEFSLLIWNIGYAGMASECTFFYDGGEMVFPAKEMVRESFDSILKETGRFPDVDFILLQEVDIRSRRSWNINQYEGLMSILNGHSGTRAINYRSPFVPVPLNRPMGKVEGGIATFSRYRPDEAIISYFGNTLPFPDRLFQLKRCFLTLRFSLENGKELIIINTHNSAFDSTGQLRRREFFILDSVMQAEYKRGNYVIAGGDWNNNPKGFDPARLLSGENNVGLDPPMDERFFRGFRMAYDSSRATNRFVEIPYQKGITRVTVSDFFICSPNITVRSVQVFPTGFRWSDHEKVLMKVKLQ